MYCPNCGCQNDDLANNCTNCGAQLKASFEAQTGSQVNNNGNTNQKSKITAGILAILLGSLGIHDFYLGNNKNGIIKLCITLLSCGFLSVISAIWGIIDGVNILTGKVATDANGNPLVD